MHALLAAAARHGHLVLIAGLAAGIAMPGLALAMRPSIGPLVAALLFLSALRVGPRQATGALGAVGASIGLAAVFQGAMPVLAILAFGAAGLTGAALATFFVLMLAAPPVSGSPNLTVMTRNDPAPALRQLVVGTALVPLTVLPVFWLTPSLGELEAVLAAAARLLTLIAVSAGAAFLIRATVLKDPTAAVLHSIDGLSAIAMSVVVIGLMSAVGPALRDTPVAVLGVLAVVCAGNFAIQLVASLTARAAGLRGSAAAIGIVAGNRNVALFITVLPAQIVDPLLLFIGCYQIPMYLTPAVLGRYYRKSSGPA